MRNTGVREDTVSLKSPSRDQRGGESRSEQNEIQGDQEPALTDE
jgi:hypothetical protein